MENGRGPMGLSLSEHRSRGCGDAGMACVLRAGGGRGQATPLQGNFASSTGRMHGLEMV